MVYIPRKASPQPTVAPHSLSLLATQNRSRSSVSLASDAGTFHSACTGLPRAASPDLRQQTRSPVHVAVSRLSTELKNVPTIPASTPMARADSGYSDGSRKGEERRSSTTPSTTSTSSRPSSKRTHIKVQSPNGSAVKESRSSSVSTRPSVKRASKSTSGVYTRNTAGIRPALQARYSTSGLRNSETRPQSAQAYQFFQFPSFTDPAPVSQQLTSYERSNSMANATIRAVSSSSNMLPPPYVSASSGTMVDITHQLAQPRNVSQQSALSIPPQQQLFWTSPETRRLEYAAIDAASKGFRGFVVRLVPDCILPRENRRTRFCEEDSEDGSELGPRHVITGDNGSVRRYRLQIEEGSHAGRSTEKESGGKKRRRWWKRLGFGKRDAERERSS